MPETEQCYSCDYKYTLKQALECARECSDKPRCPYCDLLHLDSVGQPLPSPPKDITNE